jgi:hypothetical protein
MTEQVIQYFSLPVAVTADTIVGVCAEVETLPLHEISVLSVNMGKVEVITTPGLQLLVSLEKTLGPRQGRLEVTDVGSNVRDVCRLCGLDEHLTRWMVG